MKKEELIVMKDIYKSYFLPNQREIPVLNGINISIKKGEFVALMGQSGSGKSTLLNIMGFLHNSSSGYYSFDGEDVTKRQDDESLSLIRNQSVGCIFQQYYLIPRLTTLENIMLPAIYKETRESERRKKAKELLKRVGLSEKTSNTPTELSGGEQQRVSIARSLINEPSLILADEPTGALDSSTGKKILQLLQEVNQQGSTIVMVTHDHEIASYADRIIRLKDGKVEK